jgi:hypothetical protein
MKTTSFFYAALFFFFGNIYASPQATNPLTALKNVNAQWVHQPEFQHIAATTTFGSNYTYNDWIATHLMLVEQTLRARDISHLSASQIKNRLQLLDKLNDYWQAATFPVNDFLPYKNPVFIDRKGTHCAVGYLMQQSGAEALAKQIDAEQKFAYIHEIKVSGVKEWAHHYGFTIDELAWIQPGYPPTIEAQDMNKGFDGTVNALAIHASSGWVYAAGNFSQSTKGQPCDNIAVWISGFAGYDWIQVGDGVNGTVHTLMLHNDKLYVGGEFTMANNQPAAHVAVYDINTGQWQAMGSLDSTVRALAIYNNEVYAGGDFTGMIAKWDGNNWQPVNNSLIGPGSVRALEVWNNQLVIGGNFDIITGALRKHVVAYDGTQINIMGFGTLTPVNDFEVHQNQLYAACDFVEGTDTCALAIFDTLNAEWQVAVKSHGSSGWLNHLEGNAFKQLLSGSEGLLVAGDFFCSSGMTTGANLLHYTSIAFPNDTNVYMALEPLLFTDAPVNCLAQAGVDIYFGGDFIQNNYYDTLNYVGQIQLLTTHINEKAKIKTTISAFPNPTTLSILLQCNNASEIITGYELYDATGKLMLHQKVNAAQQNISLQSLASGIYTIKVATANGANETLRVVKQ